MSQEKTIAVLREELAALEEDNRKLRRQIAELSIDELTGLMRRRMFWQIVEEEILICKRNKKSFSILVIDINGLKKVNDNYGHRAGDKLLVGFAGALKNSLRECDLIARTGGDEFMVFLPSDEGLDVDLAKKRLSLRLENISKEIPYFSGAAIGSATYGDREVTLEGLYEAADKDMYTAKRAMKDLKGG